MNPGSIASGIILILFIVSLAILYFRSRRVPSSTAVAPAAPPPPPPTEDRRILIDSLPLFTHKTSSPIISDLSPDCPVCLSSFNPEDQLRLLPYCCHAFHAVCIEKWLSTSLSCPLCRTSALREPDLGIDGEEVVERERGERENGARGHMERTDSSGSSSFSFATSSRRHENEVGSWDLD